MDPINKRGWHNRLYEASFGYIDALIWASSEAQAKQKAIEYFKPKKTKKDDIEIRLVQEYE